MCRTGEITLIRRIFNQSLPDVRKKNIWIFADAKWMFESLQMQKEYLTRRRRKMNIWIFTDAKLLFTVTPRRRKMSI